MNQNKLKQLYSLRKNFTVIGLTGRVGAGCSQIANVLSSENFIDKVKFDSKCFEDSLKPEDIKYKICADYLSFEGNYKPFHVISYKDVLLLHLLPVFVKPRHCVVADGLTLFFSDTVLIFVHDQQFRQILFSITSS